MERVVFACVHNAGRSQMAAAFFTCFADPSRAQATSAGTHPAEHIHPEVIEVMQEVGIDLSASHPQRLSEDLARAASFLITMGCGDECPHVPGIERLDWPVADPKGLPLDAVRGVRDEIRNRVATLVEAREWRRPRPS
jgi:arsenate reductase